MIYLLIFLYVLVGFCIHEVFRRYPRLSCFIFFPVPILLSPLWILEREGLSWFFWAKEFSALALSWIILVLKCNIPLRFKKWPFYLIYSLMIVNLCEATLKAFITSTAIPSILLGVTGVFIIATLPNARFIRVGLQKPHDVLWDLSYNWILAYTLWDWCFIYLAWPKGAIIQAVALLVPMLIALMNRKLYVQARACTLAFYLMLLGTFPKMFILMETPNHINEWVAWTGSILAFLWMGCQVIKKTLRR